MSLLDRLFYLAASTDQNALFPEESLYPLYERLPDASGSQARMKRILEHANLSGSELDQALITWEQSRLDGERQGFRNGFRLASMLARELSE